MAEPVELVNKGWLQDGQLLAQRRLCLLMRLVGGEERVRLDQRESARSRGVCLELLEVLRVLALEHLIRLLELAQWLNTVVQLLQRLGSETAENVADEGRGIAPGEHINQEHGILDPQAIADGDRDLELLGGHVGQAGLSELLLHVFGRLSGTRIARHARRDRRERTHVSVERRGINGGGQPPIGGLGGRIQLLFGGGLRVKGMLRYGQDQAGQDEEIQNPVERVPGKLNALYVLHIRSFRHRAVRSFFQSSPNPKWHGARVSDSLAAESC